MKKIFNYLFVTILTITIGCSVVNASETELDLESAQVTSLYNNVSVFNKITLDTGNLQGYLYMKDIYHLNDLSNDAKILMGSYKLTNGYELVGDVGEPTTFTKEEMAEAIKSILGNDITYIDGVTEVTGACGTSPHKYENDTYYFVNGCGGVFYPFYSTKLLKAIKTDTTIEIYENAIYIKPVDNSGNAVFEIYTPDKTILITTLNERDNVTNYLNKGYVYKYTFTLDNNTNEYYFTSVQKVDYKFDNTTIVEEQSVEESNVENIENSNSENIKETSVQNPNTGLSFKIGFTILSILFVLFIFNKKNKFNRL